MTGCGGIETMDDSNTKYESNRRAGKGQTVAKKSGSTEGGLFGPDGFVLYGGSGGKDDAAGAGGGGVGVNSYLWRASLDSISFMPLASADPFGGVIITEWFSPPETPAERFKINVFILGRDLRADGVRAAVFRQRRDNAGAWTDAPVEAQTATDLENSILARARQLRVATAQR
ncbi:MAG: DUF3576 domain-containing protein [Rhodospirillales bacterium]